MSDASRSGVLYTEYSALKAVSPGVASLWSFETRLHEMGRRSVRRTVEGSHEYWLERSDPLLNTILPGTGVSLVVNLGDMWAAGASLASPAFLPRACVVGPVTQARNLRMGRTVDALGAGFPSTLTSSVFGVLPADLLDRIVPLEDLWTKADVDELFASSNLGSRHCVGVLLQKCVARITLPKPELIAHSAVPFIKKHAGRVSIDGIASSHSLSRQQFARQFRAAAGLPPKLFARITRFQALVQALLSSDVSTWASVSLEMGFYDQAHMINEFRDFAGSSPTVFFQPHHAERPVTGIERRGRPAEWSNTQIG